MKVITKKLNAGEIADLQKKFGDFVKITIDIDKKIVVVGCDLHADGEKILVDQYNSTSDNIWGGGIDFEAKANTTSAVLNIRPRLHNDSMDILDPKIRNAFVEIIRDFFNESWH